MKCFYSFERTMNLKQTSYFDFIPAHLKGIILALLAFAFYFNSSWNKYVLDDGLVIVENPVTQKGISGMKEIFNSDAYDQYYKQMNSVNQLSGGRYRPLSIATYALELEFFGKNPFISHLINILLYALTIFVLFQFLGKHLFPKHADLAFLITLIYAIHPIHTEVVANIKSRDEILSFLFILLTFNSLFIFYQKVSFKHGIATMFCLMLALLSKEYALIMIVLVPILFYVTGKWHWKNTYRPMALVFVVTLSYIIIRINVVGVAKNVESSEVLNNPYMYASGAAAFATKIFVLGKYLWLSIFPIRLSYDYSFAQIAYRSFSDVEVILSFLIYVRIAFAAFNLLLKKHPLSFALFFFLGNLAMVTNFLFNIGATMGERFLYHSSLGVAIVLGWCILWLTTRANVLSSKKIFLGMIVVLVLLAGCKTISRNALWKTQTSLFIHDVKIVPNSVLANCNAGSEYVVKADQEKNLQLKSEYLNLAVQYLQKALTIHPDYVNAYLNLFVAYFRLEDYENAEHAWTEAKKRYPTHPRVAEYQKSLGFGYRKRGNDLGVKKDFPGAVEALEESVAFDPSSADAWYDLGGATYTMENLKRAREAWEQSVQINPSKLDAWNGLGSVYYNLKDYSKAKTVWEKCLEIQPGHEQASQALEALKLIQF